MIYYSPVSKILIVDYKYTAILYPGKEFQLQSFLY